MLAFPSAGRWPLNRVAPVPGPGGTSLTAAAVRLRPINRSYRCITDVRFGSEADPVLWSQTT